MKALRRIFVFAFVTALVFALPSCTQYPTSVPDSSTDYSSTTTSPFPLTVTVSETFESGTKTAYAAADVTLASGVWNLNDALLGNTTSDRKNGTQSVRARNSAKVTMKFNRTDGASTVTVKHAKYGTDANGTWQLWYSVNSGSTWTQTGGTITTSSTTLQTASFTVNVTGTIRFEIRKTDGASNRINFDDFVINDYAGGGGGGGSSNVNLTMGNPSGAVADINYPTNYLMEKTQYVLSYHRDRGEPNWTAWHLNASWIGSAARQDDFRADATLPSAWYHVQATAYSGSGYDRGHMCPSADRTKTVADNSATFLMTNMIPQAPNNNQGPWTNMENYLRTLVTAGNELYIYSGGYGSRGTVDGGHVTVPLRTWKVVIVLPEGSNDVARVTTSTRVIAVDMPNDDALISRTADWKTFRVTTDYVEANTGYNFFSNVSTTIQSVIESRVDNL
jgi:endonuclease G, mitochondrial